MAGVDTQTSGDSTAPLNFTILENAEDMNKHVPHFNSTANINNEIIVDWDHNPRLPNAIVVVVLMAIGFVGNSLVLYVYNFRMQRTVFSTFVTVLAALDLTTTLVGMPIDVVIKSMLLDKSRALTIFCKIAHFEVYSTSLASGSILLLITITRHTKVCKPLEPGLTRRKARLLCALIFTAAMVLCTVTLIINGPERIKIAVGERDYVPENNTHNTLTPENYSVADASTQSTVPFLGFTGQNTSKNLYDSEGMSQNYTNESAPLNISTRRVTEVVEVYICRTSEDQKGTVLHYVLQAVLMLAFVSILLSLLILHCKISAAISDFERRHSSMRRCSVQSDNFSMTHITASMFRIFATITFIFAISYFPHLLCLIVEKMAFSPTHSMPQTSRIVMDLMYNFPYINVIANPFIYGYRSTVFRQHCLEIFYGCCGCCFFKSRQYR